LRVACECATWWLWWLSGTGEASPVGAPCAATPPPVKSSSGRAWLAARALPRHAVQVCTSAPGE
jgi:hypothetical protein